MLGFQNQAVNPHHPERYRLVPAQVSLDDDKSTHELFLVDSQTGKVELMCGALRRVRIRTKMACMRHLLMPLAAFTAAFMLFSTAAPAQSTTEIRIRILHSKTHRPLKGRSVEVQFSGMDGKWYSNAQHLIGKTGSDGIVVFRLKQPVAPRIDIVDLEGYPCSHPEEFSSQDVLRIGVVAHWTLLGKPETKKADDWCTPDLSAPELQATPGEIVFFVHPLTFRQRRERDKEE